MKLAKVAATVAFCALGFLAWVERRAAPVSAAGGPAAQQAAGSGELRAAMVGHEFREDDWPAIATAADGTVWVAWLSFAGDRDDIALRQYRDGKWSNLQWVPNTSGDAWLPQIAVDAANRVWVVWSQQVKANWDLYARRYDPAGNEWGSLQRLTTDPLPDINPRLASDGKGHFALVWQGFRGGHSNIFLKTFDGNQWNGDVRVTNRAANDWEPAVAFDSSGKMWIAYDSYKAGNYDVFLSSVAGGKLDGEERAVAATPAFDAKATVAVDTADRVWVAWESGGANWGKDIGSINRGHAPGVMLGGDREVRIRCLENGEWREPQSALNSAFQEKRTFQPHVFSDGRGSVWVIAKERLSVGRGPQAGRGYWEYWCSRYERSGWSKAFPLPHSRGRSSTRVQAALAADATLWTTWPTDNRPDTFAHRPIRQQVYAGAIPAPAPATAPAWGAAADESAAASPAHPNEVADVRAIRGYTTAVAGKDAHIYRGDFHRHTEFSWDAGGGTDGSIQDFYRYMIDVAAMDFGASTDHQGGAWPYWWWYSQKMTDMYHVPGAYIPIFGYERSATWPNGHRNVFFARRSESRVTPFFMKSGVPGFGLGASPMGDDPGVTTGALAENDTKLLYEEIRGRNGISIPHTSGTKMGTDWRDNDPNLEPVVEIYQGARNSYEALGAPHVVKEPVDARTLQANGHFPAGMVSNAWTKGYKLGVIASSDHYSTHMSYAMVYSDDPTRQGILNAIRRRHTYGAMDNIILDVHMGEHFMGDEFALAQPLPLRVKIHGTRPIARVSVIRDNNVIYTITPNQQDVSFEYTDRESAGGRHFCYVRVEQDNQMLAWSSPMFINYR